MNEPKYKGVRAFGTRHIGNGNNGTLWGGEALRPLLDELMAKSAKLTLPKKEKSFFPSPFSSEEHPPSGGVASSEKQDSALAESRDSFSAPKVRSREYEPYKLWATSWTLRATIDASAVRHKRLEWLIGQMFHQVSRSMAEQIVKLQFDQRAAVTKADWPEHQQEFLELWRGLSDRWQESLSQAERDQLRILMTEAERDTYRIVRSYHVLAAKSPAPDFAISQANLSERLGVSKQYAGQIVARLVEQGIITRTIEPIPRLRAAHYRWLLMAPATAMEPPVAQQGVVLPAVNGAQPLPQKSASPISAPTVADSSLAPQPLGGSSAEVQRPPSAPDPCINSTQGHVTLTPPKQSVEVRLLAYLTQAREIKFDALHDAKLRQGVAVDVVEAKIARLQRACDRLVALSLAYRLDAVTVSMTTPKGSPPLSHFHRHILKNVIKNGTLDFQALQLAVCMGRGGPQYSDLKRVANEFVAVGLLTNDYRLNPDPEHPA